MRLHSRTLPVQGAEAELARFVADWKASAGLTEIETARALISVAHRQMTFALRTERHGPDSELRADEAGDTA